MEITENLKKRYIAVCDAIEELGENIEIIKHDSVGKTYYKFMRNSEIQCFEFTIDTLWKFLKEYLLYAHKLNVEVPTPKKIFRERLSVALIAQNEFDVLLAAVDARNITFHTYHEELAEEIARKIPVYYDAIRTIVDRIPV